MKSEKWKVPGIDEYYGDEAKKYKKIIRSMEDILDEYGYKQLITDILTKDTIYKENLNFLGERFLDNLVYVDLNWEDKDIVVLPEGTMKVYDYIKWNNLEKAKIYYSEPYLRNEEYEDVIKWKTRWFRQIWFEIFNYPKFDSTIEAIKLSHDLLKSAWLKKHYIRITDKRLFKWLVYRYDEKDINIIKAIIDKADDDPLKFRELYKSKWWVNKNVENEIADFLSLLYKDKLSINDLKNITQESITYNSWIDNLKAITDEVSDKIKITLLPFLAKSWDACDEVMFDARHPKYESAICWWWNLTYDNYNPEAPKSGAGIGVTRVFDLVKNL